MIACGMGKKDDDAALFREAIGPVRELPPAPEPPRKAPPRPVPRMAARDHDDAVSEFRRAMADRKLFGDESSQLLHIADARLGQG